MDQIVNLPKTESDSAIETALGLDQQGADARSAVAAGSMALLALIVIAAGLAGYQWYAGSPAKIDYTTVPAAIADLTVAVSATGTLQPLTQVDISSELSGIVRSVSVEENQQVKKGDVLAALDTAKLEVQIERAEASAKAAAANVEDATVTLAENEKALVRAAAADQARHGDRPVARGGDRHARPLQGGARQRARPISPSPRPISRRSRPTLPRAPSMRRSTASC